MDYNLCTASGVWKDLMTARFGSDVRFRTRLGYFILDRILDANRHEKMRIRLSTKTIYILILSFQERS